MSPGDWFVAVVFVLLVFAVAGGVATLLLTVGRDQLENPEILVELAEETGWRFSAGEHGLSGWKAGKKPSVVGAIDGRRIELRYDYEVVETGGKDGTERIPYLEFAVTLSMDWADVELHRRSVQVVDDAITGVDVPVGDPGFDDEFVVTGAVDDRLKDQLRCREVQRALRGIDDEYDRSYWIADQKLQVRRRLREEDGDEIVDEVRDLVERAGVIDSPQ